MDGKATNSVESRLGKVFPFLFLLVFASCTCDSLRLDPCLMAIDSLMQARPDSALQCLLGDDDHDVTDADRHYRQLLLAEARYKNDSGQFNRQELLSAMDFFDSVSSSCSSSSDAFLAARCHYMNGVGYYEQDSVVKACRQYFTALETMEERFGTTVTSLQGDKARFMALVFTHLSVLFSERYLHEQAICFARRSLPFYRNQKSACWHTTWVLGTMASHYDMMDQLDSAQHYYQLALKELADTNCLMFRDLKEKSAYLSYKRDRKPAALETLRSLCERSESDMERLSRMISMGEIFFHEQLLDSSQRCFLTILEKDPRIDSKVFSAQRLLEISKLQGDHEGVAHYSEFLAGFAKTDDMQGGIDTKLSTLFNAFEQAELLRIQKTHNRRAVFLIAVVGLALSATGLFVHHLVLKRHKAKEKQHEDLLEKEKETKEKQYEDLLEKEKETKERLSSEVDSLKELHKAKEKQYEDLLEKEKGIKERLSSEVDSLKERQRQQRNRQSMAHYKALMEEGICLDLLQRFSNVTISTTNNAKVYSNLAISNKGKRLLSDAVEKHCPGFTTILRKCYPKLDRTDLDYCRFFLIGLSSKETFVLLQLERSTVWKRIQKIQGIMDTKDIQATLMDLFFDRTV